MNSEMVEIWVFLSNTVMQIIFDSSLEMNTTLKSIKWNEWRYEVSISGEYVIEDNNSQWCLPRVLLTDLATNNCHVG